MIHTGLTLAAQDISSEDDVASLGTPDDVEELESTTGTPGSGVGSDVSTTASSSPTSRLDRVLAQLAELKVSKELEKKEDLEKSSGCVVVDLSDDDDDDFGKNLKIWFLSCQLNLQNLLGPLQPGGHAHNELQIFFWMQKKRG